MAGDDYILFDRNCKSVKFLPRSKIILPEYTFEYTLPEYTIRDEYENVPCK